MIINNNLKIAEIGLLNDSLWRDDLKEYDTGLFKKIRQSLLSDIPDIAEKYNNGPIKYFGYRRGNLSDSIYIYLQKKGLRIDLILPRDFEIDQQRAGFTISHQENFQGKADWLTGWHVPHEWQNIQDVVKWLRVALERI